jgi:hypothetical protein
MVSGGTPVRGAGIADAREQHERSASFFDLEQRKVVGELLNAWPGYSSADRSKLLCITRGRTFPPWVDRCKAAVAAVFRVLKISTPKFLTPAPSQLRSENYWILDLKSNRSSLVSQISQFQAQQFFSPLAGFPFSVSTNQPRQDLRTCFGFVI